MVSPGPEGWTAAGWDATPLDAIGRVAGVAGRAWLLLFGVGWLRLLLAVALLVVFAGFKLSSKSFH